MTRSGGSIVGRKSTTDNYSTPKEAIHALLKEETFANVVWEPAVGEGNIATALRRFGYQPITSDIRSLPDTDFQGDFLSREARRKMASSIRSPDSGNEAFDIITNPPFSKAQEFAEAALEVTTRKVALLLRIQFLESVKRKDFLENSRLKKVLVFSKRIVMYPEGATPGKGNGTQCFAWFIWDLAYHGKPTIGWL